MAYINVDTSKHEREVREGGPLPPGVYHGVVTRMEQKPTSKNGVFEEAEFDITFPANYANRKFWDRFNIVNDSPQAERIGQEAIADLGKACGISGPIGDDQALVGREVMLEIYVQPPKPYVDKSGVQQPGKPSNACRKYWPIGTDVDAARKAAKAKTGVAPATQSGVLAPATAPKKTWGAK